MTDRRYTHAELAAKVEWEGGVYDAICDYGIPTTRLPEGTPIEVLLAWEHVATSRIYRDVIDAWLGSAPELDDD